MRVCCARSGATARSWRRPIRIRAFSGSTPRKVPAKCSGSMLPSSPERFHLAGWRHDDLKRETTMKFITPMVTAFACAFATSAFAAQATFYQLPSGAFPHDVAPAPDGTVWYSGQQKGVLGRFDPKTGKNEDIPLGPGAAPHGVIIGPDGAPWLTEGGHNAIARVDPVTRKVKLFPLPREFANANLNTATFDKKGILWFTGQAGVHGRVDPETGKLQAWRSPRPGSYGITSTPDGDVWFASLAGDFIGKIDTASGAVMVVDPPRKGSGPRRIWSDSKGMLWVSFWNTGGVGRYDPATKGWKSWS